MIDAPPKERWIDPTRVGRPLNAVVWANLGLWLVWAMFPFVEEYFTRRYGYVSMMDYWPPSFVIVAKAALQLSMLLAFVIGGALAVLWTFRAGRNLGWSPLRSGAFALSFFLPVVNLIAPYLVLRTIWTKSTDRPEGGRFQIAIWWVLLWGWVACLVLENLVVLDGEVSGTVDTLNGIAIFAAVGGAFLFIRIVRKITHIQVAAYNARQAAVFSDAAPAVP
jgi:hypothetical protein